MSKEYIYGYKNVADFLNKYAEEHKYQYNYFPFTKKLIKELCSEKQHYRLVPEKKFRKGFSKETLIRYAEQSKSRN